MWGPDLISRSYRKNVFLNAGSLNKSAYKLLFCFKTKMHPILGRITINN